MKKFFFQVLKADGTVSFSRFISGVIAIVVLGWDSLSVIVACFHLACGGEPTMSILPDSTTLAGQALFMTAFYITNRSTGALNPPANGNGTPVVNK